jgi:hypothetical protein
VVSILLGSFVSLPSSGPGTKVSAKADFSVTEVRETSAADFAVFASIRVVKYCTILVVYKV